MNRGLAYYRLGDYPAAIADNNHLIQHQPHDLRAYFNRGLAQVALGQHQAAITDFNQALAQRSGSDAAILAEIYIDRGLAYFALTDVPAAIQLDSSNDRAYYNRGCMHGRQGNYIAAIQDFTQALKLNPDNPEAHLDRGVAHYNLGDEPQALKDLQQAAQFFQSQGKTIAYQRTVNLIKQVQQAQEPVVT